MKKREDIKREINTLKFVWKMATGEHGKMLIVIFLNILSGALPAGIAWVVKNYMDTNFADLFRKEDLILFFTLIVCGIFIKMTANLIMGYTMPNIKRNIEINCIKKISVLPHAYVLDCIDNRIVMTLSIESGMITSLIPMVYRSFMKAPVTILGFVILLLFVSPILTLICLVLISTVIAGVLLFRKAIKQLNKITYNRIGDLHQYFAEWLNGYKIFVASNAVKFIEKQLVKVSTELSGLSKKITKIAAIQSLIIEIITIAITVLFVVIASQNAVSKGLFNRSELILFPAAILFIRGEVLNVIYGYVQLASTESAAKRIVDIIEYPDIKIPDGEQFDEMIKALSLKNASFSYTDSTEQLLDNASINFNSGQINTVIGRSGAGKTTFINLCLRLRTLDSGAILYNGKDILSFSEKDLMRKIGLVEQEPFIFEGTLAENIFFDRTPDVHCILKLLDDFELTHLAKSESELFHTQIGQKGRQLSSGEKQRIAIIRVLAKNVDVIFFDEVTSSLDTWNAKKIIDCIKVISKDKLVICASHDIMLIQESSMLYEIINGKIICKST
ncbi:MAG: ABC transporter ATP-binding protein/permease [Dysgonamonadaceae bacterium]|nr:ABC transporter ATP-binding protein/permease [Dysgonamonadaceae bacterium]